MIPRHYMTAEAIAVTNAIGRERLRNLKKRRLAAKQTAAFIQEMLRSIVKVSK